MFRVCFKVLLNSFFRNILSTQPSYLDSLVLISSNHLLFQVFTKIVRTLRPKFCTMAEFAKNEDWQKNFTFFSLFLLEKSCHKDSGLFRFCKGFPGWVRHIFWEKIYRIFFCNILIYPIKRYELHLSNLFISCGTSLRQMSTAATFCYLIYFQYFRSLYNTNVFYQ